jgi:transcriptional regulator with GAF, ATPase, and Fis domain
MTRDSAHTRTPGHSNITALREGLNSITRIAARHRGADMLIAELSQQTLALQDILLNLEQDLDAQAFERDELEALSEISYVIGSSLDLSVVLNEVMDQIIHLTGAERSFLMLIDPDTGELEFRAARNMDRETIASSSFEISRSIVTQVAESGEPIVTTNGSKHRRASSAIICAPSCVCRSDTGADPPG